MIPRAHLVHHSVQMAENVVFLDFFQVCPENTGVIEYSIAWDGMGCPLQRSQKQTSALCTLGRFREERNTKTFTFGETEALVAVEHFPGEGNQVEVYVPPQQPHRGMWWWKHVRLRCKGLRWLFSVYNLPQIIPRSSTKGQLVFLYHNKSELWCCEREQHVESNWLFNLHSLQSSWVYLVVETESSSKYC